MIWLAVSVAGLLVALLVVTGRERIFGVRAPWALPALATVLLAGGALITLVVHGNDGGMVVLLLLLLPTLVGVGASVVATRPGVAARIVVGVVAAALMAWALIMALGVGLVFLPGALVMLAATADPMLTSHHSPAVR